MKKSMKDTTTVCPWCKMGAKARKEMKARKLPTYGRSSLSREEEKAFRKKWPVHEDWARDKGSQK